MRMNRFDWLAQFFKVQTGRTRPRREKRARKVPRKWVFQVPEVDARGLVRIRQLVETAHTKSEARAMLKKTLKLPGGYIPVGVCGKAA